MNIPSIENIPLSILELNVRPYNALMRAGCSTLGKLQRAIESDSLWEIKNLGQMSITEIRNKMDLYLQENNIQQFPTLFNENDLQDTVVPATIEGESQTFDIEVIADFPLNLLTSYFPKDQINQLADAGIHTIGELKYILNNFLSFLSPNKDLLGKSTRVLANELRTKVQSGTLSENLLVENMNIVEYLQDQPAKLDEGVEYLLTLKQLTRFESLDQELNFVFSSLTPRQEYYYLKYHLEETTLETLSQAEGITRERVRQIINASRNRIESKLSQIRLDYVNSALAIAIQLGDRLSKDSWHLELENRYHIGQQESDITIKRLFAILSDNNLTRDMIKVPDNVLKVVKSNNKYPVFLINALANIPKDKFRNVNRIVRFTGGINKLHAEEILGCNPDETAELLKTINLIEIIPDWYSIKGKQKLGKHTPIFRAGLIMMQACGPISLESFCDGVRRYISRHYDSTAPPAVILHMLKCFGFTIENEMVSYEGGEVVFVEGSEKLILDLFKEKGPVVSFQEIVEFYLTNGFSFATPVSRIMPGSPVVEKIDQGIYKLRGYKETFQELEAVKSRQEEFSRNSEVTYGLDGIIRYRVNVDTWALGGVLSISRSCQPLPDLSEGWPIYIDGLKVGQARRDESLIWGLSQAFNKLDVKLGDRLELSFDTWDEPKINIRIVEE